MKTILFYWLFINIGLHFAVAQENIIKTGDEWQYYDIDSLSYDWYKNSNIDLEWKSGISPLGYGESIIATQISYGDDSKNKDITKYFKKTFRVDDPYKHIIYKINIQRDDGIVVYLNGYELIRDNMPDGEIKAATTASSLIFKGKEKDFFTKLLSPDDLREGINTICVSVHQGRSTSSDCLFNLELIGDNNADMIPVLLKERTIKNLDLDIKIKELRHKQELGKSEQKIKILEQSKHSMKIDIYRVIFVLLVSLFGLVYLFFLNKRKKSTIDELKIAIKERDRKLMSSSLKAINNEQFLKELKANLTDSVLENETFVKKEVKNTIRKIDYNMDHDEEWLNLLSHFNSLNTGFVDRLLKLHPTLTETEKRHCIFIKLHMQTKEIAQFLNIDPRSVQTSRYRLKKKMNLNEGVDLRDYLLKL